MKGTLIACGGGLEGIQRTGDTWRISITSIVVRWEWQDTVREIRGRGKKWLHMEHKRNSGELTTEQTNHQLQIN